MFFQGITAAGDGTDRLYYNDYVTLQKKYNHFGLFPAGGVLPNNNNHPIMVNDESGTRFSFHVLDSNNDHVIELDEFMNHITSDFHIDTTLNVVNHNNNNAGRSGGDIISC